MQNKQTEILNALSVDFEDWRYPELSIYESHTSKIKDSTIRILELFKKYNVKGTFFSLGSTAEKLPHLIKMIVAQGHEIASHGYSHRSIYNLTPEEFKEDLKKSIDILEQMSGQKVLGYRAPYASITKKSLWALDILYETGIKYDCSIFPTKNFLYGIPDFPATICWQKNIAGKIVEFPFSVYKLFNKNIPIGGGLYLRLFPYAFTKHCIKKNNETGNPTMIYIHPRELDLDPPRYKVPLNWQLIFYYNLKSTQEKLDNLLKDFNFAPAKDIVQGWVNKQK